MIRMEWGGGGVWRELVQKLFPVQSILKFYFIYNRVYKESYSKIMINILLHFLCGYYSYGLVLKTWVHCLLEVRLFTCVMLSLNVILDTLPAI